MTEFSNPRSPRTLESKFNKVSGSGSRTDYTCELYTLINTFKIKWVRSLIKLIQLCSPCRSRSLMMIFCDSVEKKCSESYWPLHTERVNTRVHS